MSINSIHINENVYGAIQGSNLPFELRPGERSVYRSKTSRQSLSIKSKQSIHSIDLSASDGYIFLTNERFIYVTASQGDISTFTLEFKYMPLLQFSHTLKSPLFGANYWEFLFFSSTQAAGICDGFPGKQWYRGEIKFNDGGLFDYVPLFDKLLNDAANNQHIDEELPRYDSI